LDHAGQFFLNACLLNDLFGERDGRTKDRRPTTAEQKTADGRQMTAGCRQAAAKDTTANG